MRKRALILFSMLCLCVFGVARYVGPMAAEDETENTPAVTAALQAGKYLFQNVATGKFLGAANSWGTQASLTDNPEYQTLVLLENGKYHLESQVANGNGSHYFNGAYLDSPDAIELDIQKQENGYFTISNGNVYYGYDGSSAIVSGLETTPADMNVLWSIVSFEAATAALADATASAPQNATFLLADPNFGRNNRYFSAWTFESTNKDNNGDVKNFCVESWHANFALSQTIQVPNGVYSLAAQGFYRQEGGDYEHLPVFFANDETRVFPEITFGENSMSEVSLSFLRGNYKIKPIYVVVTDGSLEVGARLTGNGNLWCIWDDFTLKYYGTDASVVGRMRFADRFDDIVTQARSKQQTEGITAEANTLLGEALTAYESIDESAPAERQDEVEAGLKNAIDVADEGITLTTQLKNAYDSYGEKLAATGQADNSLIVVLANVQSALDNQEYESRAQVSEWLEQLTSARKVILPYEYRYWFDNNAEAATTDFSTQASWHMEVATDGLSESLHLLHIQVMDDSERWSTPISRPFVKMLSTQDAQGSYWFDNDYSSRRTASITNSVMDVDVSPLADGFHSLHYMTVASAGVSTVHTAYFQKLSGTLAFDFRIWDSEDPEQMITGKLNGNALQVNVERLTDGFHTLYVQVAGATSASVPQTAMFIKVPQTIGVDYLTCLMLVDGKLYSHEQVGCQGGTVAWKLDVDSLSQGLHRYLVQVVTPSGAGSSMKEGFFFRVPTESELGTLRCCYMVDGDSTVIQAGTVANGLYHFDLDVAKLTDGLHKIAYWLVSENGGSTTVNATYFIKIPVGGNGIIQYEYWLNDLDRDKHVAKLQERQDPFSLMALLPVETQPIRSSSFQFAIKNGKPLIYARNEIHLRFYDAAGRFTEASKEFYDEQVCEAVTDISPLESEVPATIDRPQANTIKWFSVDALAGDRLVFKTDKACTLQLYTPSGREVYKASGAASVVYDGVYAEEDGTYYLALHDVAANYGSSIRVDYLHVDKYAVLSYTPDTIGITPSYIEMQLDGNGYDKLQSARLLKGANVIVADSIYAPSKSKATIRFKFMGTEVEGTYDLQLKFKDTEENDSLIVLGAVELVEEEMGEVVVKVSSSKKVGYPYPVTISVTNTGNVSMLYVPFKIACTFDLSGWRSSASPGQSAWAQMVLMNFSLTFRKDYDPEKGEYYAPYYPFTTTYNLFGTGIPGMVTSMFIPVLGPHETKEFIVGFIGSGHAKFNLYAWTGVPMNSNYDDTEDETNIYSVWKYLKEFYSWQAEQLEGEQQDRQVRRRAPDLSRVSNMFDAADQINDFASQAGLNTTGSERATQAGRNAVAIGLAAGGYVNGLRLRNLHAYTDNDDFAKGVLQDYEDDLKNNMPTPGQIADIAGMPDWLQRLLGLQDRQASCGTPMPQANEIEIWAPGDPNDIFGYKAASDSRAVAKDVTDGYYTIEFENDPEIANAAAHKIVVKDTLDASVLDLTTFEPTSVKIGDMEIEVDKDTQYPFTIDMRPRINVIAQVDLDYNQTKGIATWTITSLDPMTMEETDDAMQGVLPVNVDGNGQGELAFNIQFKKGLEHGTEIANRASIVFDQENAIMTPTWVNVVDAIPPSSQLISYKVKNGTEATLEWKGLDQGSGIWKYDLYMQTKSDGTWTHMEEMADTTQFTITLPDAAESYGFCVLATDSAGNVEAKVLTDELQPEKYADGDANGDGNIDLTDAIMITYHSLGAAQPGLNLNAADVNRDGVVDLTDAITVVYRSLGTENGGAGQGSGAEPE